VSKPRIGFLVSGPKGLSLLQGVHAECDVQFVSSHPVKGLQMDACAEVKAFCATHGYAFVERDAVTPEVLQRGSHAFVAGWQYLIAHEHDRLVVFHDSLLPELRGFAPTVTALICGKPQIGVTAFRPVEEFDAGPIYAQAPIAISYPITIRDAYDALSGAYTRAAREVLAGIADQSLTAQARPQRDADATYSVWRGVDDYRIDWMWSSTRIHRFVDAVGWPYEGARTTYGRDTIVIDRVDERHDLTFEDRHPGKIWRIDSGVPEVICGTGVIRILAAHTLDGAPVAFTRVREQLGKAAV
jgi:methionyl-tRNA formyltransferase